MDYRLLADVVVALHVGYVACVVFGLVLILVGKVRGWGWIGNPWFRTIHLAMIVGVVIRALIWTECPLTWWERDLRVLAGQVDDVGEITFAGSPVGKVLHDLIHPTFPGWIFPVVYSLFGLLIFSTFWLAPVHWSMKASGGGGPPCVGAKRGGPPPPRSPGTALFLCLLFPWTASAQEPIWATDAKLEVVAKAPAAGEGPVWHPKLGVLTSGNGHIYRLDLSGKSSIWRKDAGTNGLLFDAKGRLVACESRPRRISRTEADGTIHVLTDRYEGKRYNTPNDLTIDSKGRIFFSDPRYGSRRDMEMRDDKNRLVEGVYRIDPDNKVTRVLGKDEVDRPNGVLVSADDRYLYVADNNNDTAGAARKLWRFDLGKDGNVDPKSRKLLYDWGQGRGPDGLKQDVLGRLYVAGGLNKPNPPAEPATDVKGGIYVLSPEGKLLTFLAVPTDEVTNCAFGDEDRKTLYVTGGGVLYKIRTTTAGRLVWPAAK